MSTQDGEKKTSQSRQAVAARNIEAILDSAEALILAGVPLNFSALAAQAGVSRPTVYSHFPGRAELLSAVMERSVRLAVVMPDCRSALMASNGWP